MRNLIILRPCNQGDSFRLGLYKSDFRRYVQHQEVTSLSVDIGSDVFDLSESIQTYTHHGSLTSSEIANWLRTNHFADPKYLFLFELSIDEGEHSYKLIGSQKTIFQLFISHWR